MLTWSGGEIGIGNISTTCTYVSRVELSLHEYHWLHAAPGTENWFYVGKKDKRNNLLSALTENKPYPTYMCFMELDEVSKVSQKKGKKKYHKYRYPICR